jgi:glutamate--cysteine ligase
MMRRTATVQSNFDYSSEADAMRKLSALLRTAPIINAMTASSPFREGRISAIRSLRGRVWLRMDPSRSGLIEALWRSDRLPSYRDYADWALDAGMFLFKRKGVVVANTGQTFRSFLEDGFQGYHPTSTDWKLHLNTLFPEARLKRTLEVRSADSSRLPVSIATIALHTGLVYDDRALDETLELMLPFGHAEMQAARSCLVVEGLHAKVGSHAALGLAERLLEISQGGLERRNVRDEHGHTEAVLLEPLQQLIAKGRTPADEMVAGLQRFPTPAEVIDRARLERPC